MTERTFYGQAQIWTSETGMRCPLCNGCGIANYFQIPTNERSRYALKPKQLTAGPEVANV